HNRVRAPQQAKPATPSGHDATAPCFLFFFSSRRRHTRSYGDWSSDVCSSDLQQSHSPRNLPRREVRPVGSGQRKSVMAMETRLRSEERRVGKECRAGGVGEQRIEKEGEADTVTHRAIKHAATIVGASIAQRSQ